MDINSWITIIKKFKSKKILVVGDIMIDQFIWGNVDRVSPEAPVPVVEVIRESEMPGGCGNVAKNIVSLGGKAKIATVVGNDDNGLRLKKTLADEGVDIGGIITDIARPTTLKTRIVAHSQQVVRIDKESKSPISHNTFSKIKEFIQSEIKNVDAILISDYGKGVITKSLLKFCVDISKDNKIPITVDPKIEHFLEYKKVSVITPNLNEATLGMKAHKKPTTDEEVEMLGKKILSKLKCEALVITRGEKGMTLFQKNEIYHIPTRAKEVFDVTGAGDTVIATLTLALACKANIKWGCEIANFAAGVVVGKVGTATVNTQELEQYIKNY